MNRKGLLIFDLDGTLFQVETAWFPAIRQIFDELGLSKPSDNDLRALIGKPVDEIIAWYRSRCQQENIDKLALSIYSLTLAFVPVKGKLYQDIPAVLTDLKASVGQMALYSNGLQEYVEHVANTLEIMPFFDAVRCPVSSMDSKPSMIRELLGMLPSRPAIVIGDRYDDIKAAHENDLLAIAVKYGYGKPEELVESDAEIASPSDLPNLVHSLLHGQA
jgi:phosphoglycolate phosphatase